MSLMESFLSYMLQGERGLTNLEKVTVLSEALPLIQKFKGKTIVVKYGGAAMKDPTLKVNATSNLRLSIVMCWC